MHTFDTPGPVTVRLEFGAGSVAVDATDTTTTTVDLQPVTDDDESRAAVEATVIEQRGQEILVKVPRGRMLRRNPQLALRMVVPSGTRLSAEVGSADVVASGRYGTSDVKAGSGDVTMATIDGDARVASGAGDVTLTAVTGAGHLRAGSGNVRLDDVGGDMSVGTGSGDVTVGRAGADLLVKTGSGDIRVNDAEGSVTMHSGSGNLTVERVGGGKVSAKSASGDVEVGVSTGSVAWLDLNSVSGRIDSALDEGDAPAAGELVVEIRASSVSGDVRVRRA
jgi:DUF4097 and DUF4098 domain-containing protein YvlB